MERLRVKLAEADIRYVEKKLGHDWAGKPTDDASKLLDPSTPVAELMAIRARQKAREASGAASEIGQLRP